MKNQLITLLAGFSLLLASSQLQATTVNYTVTDLGLGLWEYEYTITNDSLATDIEEFTIFFDDTLFGTLGTPGQPNGIAPIGWDPLVVQEPTIFNGDGFYDALALGPRIAPGATLGGFSLQVVFDGLDTPGSNRFQVIEPFTFASIGPEIMTMPAVVPVPAAIWLFGSALLGLAFVKRKVRS